MSNFQTKIANIIGTAQEWGRRGKAVVNHVRVTMKNRPNLDRDMELGAKIRVTLESDQRFIAARQNKARMASFANHLGIILAEMLNEPATDGNISVARSLIKQAVDKQDDFLSEMVGGVGQILRPDIDGQYNNEVQERKIAEYLAQVRTQPEIVLNAATQAMRESGTLTIYELALNDPMVLYHGNLYND